MEAINIINTIARVSYINIATYVVFIKLIHYQKTNYMQMSLIIIMSIAEATIGKFLISQIEVLPAMLVIYSLQSFIASKLTNRKFQYSIAVTYIALAIVYLTYAISIILTGILTRMMLPNIPSNNPIILFIIVIIESIILFSFFKIRRLKNGLSFLQNTEKVNNIGFAGFALIGVAMLIYSTLGTRKYTTYIFIGIIIECICLAIWISKKITKYYKQKLKEQTIEALESEINEKNKKIDKILEENNKIATINHKYSNRIQALEKFSYKIVSNPKIVETMKTEFGEDFAIFQKQIEKLSEEFSNETSKIVEQETKLEKTGIFGIDNLLEYMSEEAKKDNIKFNLKINGNINYMIEKVIEQSKLETLLGDHIKDAIIAVRSSNNTYRSILTTIGIIDNCYEICIYDTGIEFEIETLLKLGLETITTHKDTGGTGIGFMTTFETLKSTKASLIIEEKHPMNNTDYTKAIVIRFDGKNEYKIRSYRAEEIIKQKKDNRIIVQNIL